jgi:hypothetical protein
MAESSGYHPAHARSFSEDEQLRAATGGKDDKNTLGTPRDGDLYYDDSDASDVEVVTGVSKVEAAQAVW